MATDVIFSKCADVKGPADEVVTLQLLPLRPLSVSAAETVVTAMLGWSMAGWAAPCVVLLPTTLEPMSSPLRRAGLGSSVEGEHSWRGVASWCYG